VGELAGILGIDEDHVARLARQAVVVKAKRGEYLLVESLKGYITYQRQSPAAKRDAAGEEPTEAGADYERERARLTKEKADKAAMDNQLMRGELHDGKAVAHHVGQMLAAFRAKVLSLPNACAGVVANLSTADECFTVLDDHCRDALTELSEYDPAAVVGEARKELAKQEEPELEPVASPLEE
jgi:phage terminase Nu1 subunit (DNA packaging protein)